MRDISLHDLIPTGAEGLMLRQDARHLPSHLIPTGDEGLMPRPEARHLPVHPPTPYHPPPSRCVSPFRFAGCPATELGCRDKASDRNPVMHTSAFEKEKYLICEKSGKNLFYFGFTLSQKKRNEKKCVRRRRLMLLTKKLLKS